MAEQAMWYVVQTYSGYENKVAETIRTVVENRKLTDQVVEVKIPTEKAVEVGDSGVEKEVEHKLFPGYVFVKMIMNDDSWYIVRNTRGVTGFVGPGGTPVPLTEKEIAQFRLDSSDPGAAQAVTAASFSVRVGDEVRINDGVMEGFVGTVKSIDEGTLTAEVVVSMFGRETAAQVALSKLEHVPAD